LPTQSYEEGLRAQNKQNNRQAESALLGNIGSVYLFLGDIRKAVGYYEQALII